MAVSDLGKGITGASRQKPGRFISRDITGFPLKIPGTVGGLGRCESLSSAGQEGQQVPGQGSASPWRQALLVKASVHSQLPIRSGVHKQAAGVAIVLPALGY